MIFMTAVREACETSLLDRIGQICLEDWQAIYNRTENATQFCATAKKCGYDARDEGDGVIGIYSGPNNPMTRIYRIMGRPGPGSRITILKDGFTDRMDAVVYKDTEQSANRMDPKAYVTSRKL